MNPHIIEEQSFRDNVALLKKIATIARDVGSPDEAQRAEEALRRYLAKRQVILQKIMQRLEAREEDASATQTTSNRR